jgi:hypothetical protein
MLQFQRLILVCILCFAAPSFSQELDVASSAKACIKVLANSPGVFEYSQMKSDEKNVVIEEKKLAPIHISEIKKYFKLKSNERDAKDAVRECLDRSEFKNQTDAITQTWDSVTNNSEFNKDRHPIKVSPLYHEGIIIELKGLVRLACGTNPKCGIETTKIFVNDSEEEMLKEYELKCSSNMYSKRCKERAVKASQKLFPNFVYAAYTEYEFNKFVSGKSQLLETKLCQKNKDSFIKAHAALENQESVISQILKGYGFREMHAFGFNEQLALDALIMNTAHILNYSYKLPPQEQKELKKTIGNKKSREIAEKERLRKMQLEAAPVALLYYPSIPGDPKTDPAIITNFTYYFGNGLEEVCPRAEVTNLEKSNGSGSK